MASLDRKSVFIYLPIAAAVVIMIAAGIVQGQWSERWGTFPELEIFAKQLPAIPMEFGEWKGVDRKGTDEAILKVAGAEGELVRTYTNASSQSVQVSIICARLQHIFAHTPERCYPAAGFEMMGEPQSESFEFGDKHAEFFTTSFLKSEPTGTHSERGFWSWSADGNWIAPKNYKLRFAGQKALYKLYIFAAVPPGAKKSASPEFYEDFIREFIPVLDESLKPAFDAANGVKPDEAVPVAPPIAPPA